MIGTAAVLLLLAGSTASRPAAPAPRERIARDTVPQEAVIELQIGRLASQTIVAFRSDSTVLLPVSQFMELAEIRYQFLPEGGMEAVLQPGNVRFAANRHWDTLTVAARAIPLTAGTRLIREGEFYLSADLLSEALGLHTVISWSDLLVSVTNAEVLPIGRRLEREAARRAGIGGSGTVIPELALSLNRRRWGGMVLDYSILSPAEDMVGGGSYAAALGLDLLGGSLEMSSATVGRLDEGHSRTDLSWTGVWRGNRWLKQLRLGDGLSTGPRPRSVRGFSITNAPYLRSPTLGDINYNGHLGPGWQIEAYRGGRLIAFDSADALGEFGIDVPIQYGENPVDFVAYGPFGEIRQFNQTYRAVGNLLPYRRFEYGVAGGQCRTDRCGGSANVDLRYGVARRWTIGAGVDQFWRDSVPNLFHPYLTLTGNVGNAWVVELEGVAHAVARGAVSFEPSADLRVSAEVTGYAGGTVAPILTPAGRRSQWTAQAFYRPMVSTNSMYLDASVDRITSVTGSSSSARAGVSFQLEEIRFIPSLRIQRDAPLSGEPTTHGYVGVNTVVLPHPTLGPFLGAISARSMVETEASMKFVSASMFLSRPVTQSLRMETGVSWSRGLGPSVSIIVSTNLPTVRAFTTVTSGAGQTSATNFVQGSVLYNPASHGAAFESGPSLQRAGVSGQVFLDANGNGRLDPDEERLPDVRVRVGMFTAVSDSQGRYRIWDLSPFEPVLLTVDTLSLGSPLWVPLFGAVSIEPAPNQFQTLNVPVAPGGVIEGQVVREAPDGLTPVAGMTVVLTDLRTNVRRTLVTFSDGAFYLIGVKPGEYQIEVSQSVSGRLHMQAEPVRFSMAGDIEGATVSGLQLVLRSPSGSR